MDLKTAGLTNKWNNLLNKGASIAKESLDFVNKQITDIRTNRHPDEIATNHTSPFSSVQSSEVSNNDGDDWITSALVRGEIPVIYYFHSSYCPTQCTICSNYETFLLLFNAKHSLESYPSQYSSNTSDNAYMFLLPEGIKLHELTVRKFKQLIPPSISITPVHIRFKVETPLEDQDLFPEFIWLDVLDDQIAPTFKGAIHVRFLELPKSFRQLQPSSTISDHRKTSLPFHRLYHPQNHSINQSSSIESSSSSNLKEPNRKIDLLGSVNSSCNSMKSTDSCSLPIPHITLSCVSGPVSNHLSNPKIQLDRNVLISQREAQTQARVQEVMNEYAARRERELAHIEAKDSASEQLQHELDRWALTNDGQYKDLRALLSSLTDVLWEDNQWQSVSLSELVVIKQNEFKKLYRTAILLCHPDKHQSSSPSTQYRAQRIFQALNESFKSMSTITS